MKGFDLYRSHSIQYWDSATKGARAGWACSLLLLSTEWYAQGVPYTATITDLLCFSIRVLIIPDSSTTALWQLPADTPSSKAWRNLARYVSEFCLQYTFSYCRVL
jgi:hypothetical protein